MLVVALVAASLAALVHVYIFVLESLRWSEPETRRVFGTTAETARVTAPLAYNQGFYNLFLAAGVAAGVFLVVVESDAGVPLLVFGCGSMLAASLVLVLSDHAKARAALVQGAMPAVALLALLAHSIAS